MPGHPPVTSRRTLLAAIAAPVLARASGQPALRPAHASGRDATIVAASPVPADLAAALPSDAALADLGLVATRRDGVATYERAAIGRLLPADDPAATAWRAGAVLIVAPADPDARFTSAGLAIDAWPDADTAATVVASVARTLALTAVHLPDHAAVRNAVPGVTTFAYIDADAEHVDVLVLGYVASLTLCAWVTGGLDCDPRPASHLLRATYDHLAH